MSTTPAPGVIGALAETPTLAQHGPVPTDSTARHFGGEAAATAVTETRPLGALPVVDPQFVVVHRRFDATNRAGTEHDSPSEPAVLQGHQGQVQNPIQPGAGSAATGRSTILRSSNIARERFVVGAAQAGSNFSYRFLQRVSNSWSGSKGGETTVAAALASGSHVDWTGPGRARGGLSGGYNPTAVAPPRSSVARFAADKLSSVNLSGAWPALLEKKSGAEMPTPGPQRRLSLSVANPVSRSVEYGPSGVPPIGASLNTTLMVNRLPNAIGFTGFPGESATGFPSTVVGAPQAREVPIRHIASSPSPIRALQRQPQGASVPATGSSAAATSAPAAVPPPATLPQNAAPDVGRLAEQVYRLIVQRIATERDRRGL